MGEALQNIASEPAHSVEVIVHITETLGEMRRKDLVAELQKDSSIVTAEFCPLRYHLMLLRYDRDSYTSQDALARVRSHNVNACLIGPV